MATVYLVRTTFAPPSARVAVKILHARDETTLARFQARSGRPRAAPAPGES